MASLYVKLLLLCVFCVNLSNAEDLHVGATINTQLAFSRTLRLSSTPFSTRTKNLFYSNADNKNIKGISAIDLEKSNARVAITAGGVGSTYVNLRIKSERGDGLNYLVQVFV